MATINTPYYNVPGPIGKHMFSSGIVQGDIDRILRNKTMIMASIEEKHIAFSDFEKLQFAQHCLAMERVGVRNPDGTYSPVPFFVVLSEYRDSNNRVLDYCDRLNEKNADEWLANNLDQIVKQRHIIIPYGPVAKTYLERTCEMNWDQLVSFLKWVNKQAPKPELDYTRSNNLIARVDQNQLDELYEFHKTIATS